MQGAVKTQKNIRWINYIRAICCIMIYYIHAEEFFEFSIKGLSKYILPVYVNAYYFVSGYLLFKKQMPLIENGNFQEGRKSFLLNILFRLVIASLIFSIIEFIPGSLLQRRDMSIQWLIEKTIWGRTYWFISSLVSAELILYGLFQSKIKNVWFYFITGIGLFAIGYILLLHHFRLTHLFESNPWQFDKGLVAIVFIVFGGIYWKYETIIDRYLRNTLLIFSAFLIYIVVITLFNSHIKVLISMSDINIEGVIISLLGIYILVALCKLIQNNNKATDLLNAIGQNTIGLYFVSGAIPKVLMIILPKVFPKANLPYMLFGFASSFLLSCAAVSLMIRYTPFLFDLRNGKKVCINNKGNR